MAKPKKSGPAIFMYCVITVSIVIAAVCFILYYGGISESGVILWTGVTFFTVVYHLWGRLIMGNVTKLWGIRYTHFWFKERPFEKKIYEALRVKHWKDRALTYNPELYNVKERTMEQIANTMAKSETDHWVNVGISLSTLLFALLWGEFWIFLITAVAAILFDGQFILIQRYNRPRVLRILAKKNKVSLSKAG